MSQYLLPKLTSSINSSGASQPTPKGIPPKPSQPPLATLLSAPTIKVYDLKPLIDLSTKPSDNINTPDIYNPTQEEIDEWLQQPPSKSDASDTAIPNSVSPKTSPMSSPSSTSTVSPASTSAHSVSKSSSTVPPQSSTGVIRHQLAGMEPEKIREALIAQYRKLTTAPFNENEIIKDVSEKLIEACAEYHDHPTRLANEYRPPEMPVQSYRVSRALGSDENIQVVVTTNQSRIITFGLGDTAGSAVVFDFRGDPKKTLLVVDDSGMVTRAKFDVPPKPSLPPAPPSSRPSWFGWFSKRDLE